MSTTDRYDYDSDYFYYDEESDTIFTTDPDDGTIYNGDGEEIIED